MALTKRQKEVLDYLAEFITNKGYSPSFEEIAGALNLASLATVHKHISALEAKNYVRRSYNQSRSLEITSRAYEETNRRTPAATAEVPLLGRIAAGSPVEAVQGAETLNFGEFIRDENTYALQVRGESMIEDHICSGDYVLVERAPSVRDGDIVVALVEGSEATLKRFYREPDGTIRLQPANSAMQPIRVAPANLEIQGRVLAVLRKFQ